MQMQRYYTQAKARGTDSSEFSSGQGGPASLACLILAAWRAWKSLQKEEAAARHGVAAMVPFGTAKGNNQQP
jgi:hypothetical protein